MKYLYILVSTFLYFTVSAQNFIDRHFPSLEDIEESTVIHVTGKSFDIAAKVMPDADEEDRQIREFIGSIDAVDVIVVPSYEYTKRDYRRAIEFLDGSFEELISYKEKDQRFSVHIGVEDDIVYEIVAVGHEQSDELIMISVTGALRLDMISRIIESIPVENIGAAKNIKRHVSKDFTIYPNPAARGTQLHIDAAESWIDGEAQILDLSGKLMTSFTIDQIKTSIDGSQFAPGTYAIILKKEGITIQKKFIILE